MVLDFIDDMNKALDNDCFFSALAIALMLPDICGKAEYLDKGNKDRYISWYDKYVGVYEQCQEFEGEMPYLSGEVVYQLRCSFLHAGDFDIEKKRIKEECCKIDSFTLITEKKKRFNSMIDASYKTEHYGENEKPDNAHYYYEVNVRGLCYKISTCAKAYYLKNQNRFNFFNCNVVDLDERYKQLKMK